MPTATISRCGGTSGLTLNQVVVGLAPDFWYKQGESSGTTAHDSTGNGWDATVPATFAAPLWGQTAGPPGTTSAQYRIASNDALENTSFPSMSGDLTLFTYAYLPLQGGGELDTSLMGQGTGGGRFANVPGVSLVALAFNQGQTFAGFIGNNAGIPHTVVANATYTAATWYAVALRRSSGVWNIFQGGVKQTSTYTEGVYSPAAADVWLGHVPEGGVGGSRNDPLLSYSMGWGARALSDSDIALLSSALP